MFKPMIYAILIALSATVVQADPIIIAHRGASGYLPEETLEAYAYAYASGADFLEPDLIFTKDKQFICMHDTQLETTTNVKDVFPDRKREDGHWYAADFTLAEIKTLQAHERMANRFPKEAPGLQVATFEELIQLVQGLNKTTGRTVGIYPELKDPTWHEQAGFDMVTPFLEILKKYGYTGKDAKCYVQCFEPGPLKKLQELKNELPRIMLMSDSPLQANMLTDAGLTEIAKFANGIGPDLRSIEKDPTLVERAHKLGLVVHPYTLRKDQLPATYKNFDEMLHAFCDTYKVDGFFTDFSDLASAYLRNRKK